MLRKDQNGAPLAMYPSVGSALQAQRYVSEEASLAMYPLVGFAFQAQGYVSKGRRFLSDAPFGRFP